MSVPLLQQAWNASLSPPSLKLVYLAFCWKALPDTQLAHPGLAALSGLTGMHITQIRRKIRQLESLRLLTLERRGNGKGHASLYRVHPISKSITAAQASKGSKALPFAPVDNSAKGSKTVPSKGSKPRYDVDSNIDKGVPPSAAAAPRSLYVERLQAKHCNI